jgi:fructose-specific phosphotransferase system IIC component
MRLLLFVSAFGILISIAVLIAVILKAKKDQTPPKMRKEE